MKILLLLSCGLIFAGCAHRGPVPAEPPPGIPDTEIGLSKSAITAVADPLAYRAVISEPGEAPLPKRAYTGAPPVIPHTVEAMLPITKSENPCIECHAVDTKAPGEATPIPASHYVDLRNAPDVRRDTVAGSRYECSQCHALQTDATPLVGNSF